MPLSDNYERNVKYFAQRNAFVFENKSYTFEVFNRRVNQLINALQSRGVKKGECIVVVLQNCSELLELFGAAEKGGFIIVPLNPKLSAQEVREIIDDAEAKVVVLGEEHTQYSWFYRDSKWPKLFISTSADDVLEYADLVLEGEPIEPCVTLSDDDLVYLIYTSGTTGKPKGVMIDHKSQIENNKTTIIEMGINSDDSVFNCLPLNHLGGKALISNYFARGCTNYIAKKFNVEQVLKTIEVNRVTTLICVPSMLWSITSFEGLSNYDLTSLHTIFYSGSPISKSLLQRSIECFGNVLIQFYGMTEAGPIIMVLPKKDHVLDESRSSNIKSCGIPAISNKVRIIDEHGLEVQPGQVGEIIVRTPAVMRGYWNKPLLTKETLRDGWLYTGDLGTVDEQNYSYIVGRKKDMIISGGENIYAHEVEVVINTYPSVKEVAVIGVPHDKWGETVMAVVVMEEGTKATESQIIEYCKSRLASYKKPSFVVFVEELPLNALGKVQKTTLKERYSLIYSSKA